ncbi:MAG: DGQHR domain-containing protein [Chloroflexi bacterium]|nr:DGQHR domain-containing protein [Chloroflexota bacterium]
MKKDNSNTNFSFSEIVRPLDELSLSASQRTNEYVFDRVSKESEIPSDWVLDKELQSVKRIKKKKEMWKLFEDRLWLMFYKFEFEELNNAYEPEIILPTTQQTKKRFDVIAKAEEFVFFVECKSNSKPGPRPNVRETIIALNDAKPYLKKIIQKHYDNDYLEAVMVLALENVNVSEQDLEEARRKNVKVWDASTLSYLEQLSSLTGIIGVAARYQLYAMMFPDKKHQEHAKLPAIQQKHAGGKITYYSFMATPEQLLKIAYVHRRGSSVQDAKKVVLTYQRMIEPAKLKAIHEYINKQKSLPFPNSIIINFNEKVVFELAPQRDNINNGMLRLPRSYGSAWVIDGQHRLFGYAMSERRKKDLVPVIAFEKLSDAEQARLFVDINLNQKSVSANLMWDLKEDIYEGTEDPKQRKDLIISKVGKRLAASDKSPLFGAVSLPSSPELGESAPVTLNAICAAIKNSRILEDDYYGTKNLEVDNAVELIYSGLLEHFSFFANNMQSDWDAGKQGFTKSANGISALIWLYRQTLHYLNYVEEAELYRLKSKRKDFAGLLNTLYQPIVEQFEEYGEIADKLRMKRGASGQKESANDLCIYIQSQTPGFPPLLRSQMKITKETDLNEDDELDLAIKNTELKIRGFVKTKLSTTFGIDWYRQKLPGDIKTNIDDFVNSDIKKYPYKQKGLRSSDNKFEYIQLTDLKKTILSVWVAFEDVFNNKVNFTSKMEEFVSLRNAFRGHPRQIDEAQRNSGRGAMIWLNECIDSVLNSANEENDTVENGDDT